MVVDPAAPRVGSAGNRSATRTGIPIIIRNNPTISIPYALIQTLASAPVIDGPANPPTACWSIGTRALRCNRLETGAGNT